MSMRLRGCQGCGKAMSRSEAWRRTLAQALVRVAGSWWDASYSAYCRVDRGEVWSGYEKPWFWMAARIDHAVIPLACRLDGDAAAEQMVEEAWWG